MANPKNLRTVSAAIPLELHARLVALVYHKKSTIGKTLSDAIQGLVGSAYLPADRQRTAIHDVLRVRELIGRLRRQSQKAYPPNAVAAITKVLAVTRAARPSFLFGGPGESLENEHNRFLVELSGLLAKAKEDADALARAWAASRPD